MPRKSLIEVKGLSDAKVEKMLEAAMKILPGDQSGSFVTASEFLEMVRRQLCASHSCAHSCALFRPSIRVANRVANRVLNRVAHSSRRPISLFTT